ncbi:hypothetical protein MUK60_20810 [Streptomyces sp. LRE541]|uniref:TRADD-N-associated membrane domain-containing protein n=1 Tax=Streptomyces sp. LRE541 TaxID=2931983 RepID=UPI00200D6FD4|nr:hypothetical protein [Streptomyces sp. LRE541]UPZ30004.1 hypothetical protein MUK60_20810 [Streptomyces sp. LRE541]
MAQSEPRGRNSISIIISLTMTVILMGLAIAAIATGVAPDWLLPAASAALGILVATGNLWQQDDPRQAESRERVRTAEQGLEDVLRRAQVPATADDEPLAPGQGRRATESQEDARARLALSELWTVTHRRLDHYHGIALGQAKQSFRNAQIAMILGFALLVGFVIVALNASTAVGSVVAGGLGAVSATLAGYVSRTFIRSQEAAAGHLRAYFDQPLEFSRYLAAERLVADAGLSEERRAEVLSLLVQAMIAGPSLQAAAGTNEQQPGNTT